MNGSSVDVVFIGGSGRSGSTLLERLLAARPGVVGAGELRALWDAQAGPGQRCGCGEPLTSCPVWSTVVDRVFDGFDSPRFAEMQRLNQRVNRIRHLPSLLAPWRSGASRRRLESYREGLGATVRAFAEVTGARVVVDSTKNPPHGRLLAGAPGIDVAVVHLIRDARAVAHSWGRSRPRKDIDAPMDRYGPARAALGWVAVNLLMHLLRGRRRAHRLRYEDLVAAPEGAVDAIIGVGGDGPPGDPLVADLGTTHGVRGNPMRFETGRITITADVAWRDEMPRGSRAVVTAITWPLLVSYGYLRPGRSR